MDKVLIWDLPTRLFHWLLTVGLVVAFGIAQFVSHRSIWFPVHMILGVSLGVMVLLRVVWLFLGTRYARWGDLLFSPRALATYLKTALVGAPSRYAGHNPGSAYASIAMLALVAVIVVTGLFLTMGSEAAEEIHALAAYALAAVVAIHVAGVVWHTWRVRENLTLTMITGWKEAPPTSAIDSARPHVGAVFALLVVVLTAGLLRNYDQAKRQTTLPGVGTVIRLSEAERERDERGEPNRRSHRDDSPR
jgi:cytochrome b